MNKIVCCHCYRNNDIVQVPNVSKGGSIIGHIYICTTCQSFMKKVHVDIRFETDDEKIESLKKVMKLNGERIDNSPKKSDKTEDNGNKGLDKKQ